MPPLIDFPSEVTELVNSSAKWTNLLQNDPREDLLMCPEPFTSYRTLTDLLEIDPEHDLAHEARSLVVTHNGVQSLIKILPDDWESYLVKGHNKADYPPSVVLLLFDFGIVPSDSTKIDNLLKQMLALQDETGRFLSLAQFPRAKPMVGSSLCDTHIITEALLSGGYGSTTEVQNAIKFMKSQVKETNQGIAWKCEPNSVSGVRGPGRKDDICPQASLEALRVFSLLPANERPNELVDVGHTILKCWESRKEHRPYMFGMGTRFKKLRPPFFWYNIAEVLDVLSRYPTIVEEPKFQEMLDVVISVADENGHFTPASIYRKFKDWSFGQKKVWSPWTTFYICRILKRVYA